MELNKVTLDERPIIAIRRTVPDPGPLFDEALPRLFDFVATNGFAVTGPPLGVYYDVGDGEFDMAVALPVAGEATEEGDITAGSLPAGPAVTVEFTGHYDGLGDAWSSLRHAIADAGHEIRAEGWEEYLVGPESGVDPTEFQTTLVQTIE